jgi:methylmalonyl-CoA mutase C-terminal domain/subunit
VESVVSTAVQEDVDYIGISILDGGETLIAEDLMKSLKTNNINNVKVIFGGIIPERSRPVLRKLGVKAIFGPGTPVEKIISFHP